MNTVNFFGNSVTKLIIGDNPMNGHSYIEDVTPGSEMMSFYTAERIKEAIFRAEELGFNTMLPLADPYMIRLLQEYRRDGGKMQFIFDPANYVQCDRDPLDVYPLLKDKIAYFHIKDARMDNKRVVPAGTGSGRIPQILKDYAQTHENTMLTLEPHLKAFAGLKDEVSIQYDEEAAYKDNNEAFDAGVAALKKILDEEGLSYE